jgi:hypothetical protein
MKLFTLTDSSGADVVQTLYNPDMCLFDHSGNTFNPYLGVLI